MAEETRSATYEIMEDSSSKRLDYLHVRALAYSVPGEMDEVARLASEAQELYRSSRAGDARTHAALTAGICQWAMCQYSEAIQSLGAVSDHPEGAYFCGLSQIETGDYEGALGSFRKAVKAGQEEFACAMGEVDALRRAGKIEEACEKMRTYQKSHGDKAELHYQKGRCLEAEMEYEPAMDAYNRVLEIEPQHVGALFRLAYWNDLRGNDEAALDYYEKAAGTSPVRRNVLLNLGNLYEDRGENEKAARLYERVLAVNPRDLRARMYHKDALGSLNMLYDETVERRANRTATLLRTPLNEFELSARCRSCLEKMNVRTLGDLARLTEDEIADSKNFGETSLTELRELLESKGLHFGMGKDGTERGGTEILAASPKADILAKPVTELDLAIRAQKCMRALDVYTIGDLTQRTEKELLQSPNFGQTSLNDIKRKLEAFGLSLKPREI